MRPGVSTAIQIICCSRSKEAQFKQLQYLSVEILCKALAFLWSVELVVMQDHYQHFINELFKVHLVEVWGWLLSHRVRIMVHLHLQLLQPIHDMLLQISSDQLVVLLKALRGVR